MYIPCTEYIRHTTAPPRPTPGVVERCVPKTWFPRVRFHYLFTLVPATHAKDRGCTFLRQWFGAASPSQTGALGFFYPALIDSREAETRRSGGLIRRRAPTARQHGYIFITPGGCSIMAPDLSSVHPSGRPTTVSSNPPSTASSRRTSQLMGPPPPPLSPLLGSFPTSPLPLTSGSMPTMSGSGFGASAIPGDNSGVGAGPGPMRHPRPLTPADLHLQLEKEQEAVVSLSRFRVYFILLFLFVCKKWLWEETDSSLKR